MLMVLEPNYDMDSFQSDKPFDAPNLHSDLARAFPNLLLLSSAELEHMREEDPFRFELIQFIHRLTDIDPKQRPTPSEVKNMIEFWEMLYAEKMQDTNPPRRKFSISNKKGIAIPQFSLIKRSKSSEPDKSPKSAKDRSPKQATPKQPSPTQHSPQTNNNDSPCSKLLQSSLPETRARAPSKSLQRSSPEVLSSSRRPKEERKEEG